MTATSRRCFSCRVNWPSFDDFKLCCKCDGVTFGLPIPSIDEAEAAQRLSEGKHRRFFRWLREHDRFGEVERLEQIPTAGASEQPVYGD